MALADSRARQLFSIARKFFPNSRNLNPILLLPDLGLLFTGSAQLDFIEPWVARDRRFMSVPFRSEIDMGFARHDDMHPIMNRCDGELVGRFKRRLRGDERPRADAGVRSIESGRGSKLNRGDQSKKS